MGIVIL